MGQWDRFIKFIECKLATQRAFKISLTEDIKYLKKGKSQSGYYTQTTGSDSECDSDPRNNQWTQQSCY